MARVDRIFARRAGNFTKAIRVRDGAGGKTTRKRVPHVVDADPWWRNKLPEVADRNLKAMAKRATKRIARKAA